MSDSKLIVVRATIEYVVEVPVDYDQDKTEFRRNESGWCCDNGLEELTELAERLEKADRCACPLIKYEYVRDATEDDKLANAWNEGNE